MKSIRRSLVFYFLLLALGSLGAISWLAFRSARSTLQEKAESTRNLVLAQHRQRTDEAHTAFDRRLLDRARHLGTSLSREGASPSEMFNVLGVLGLPLAPQGPLNSPLWLAEGLSPAMATKVHRMRPIDSFFPMEEAGPDDAPLDYCQTYLRNGIPWQRSKSLKDQWFELDPTVREKINILEERYDEVKLRTGERLRRVTLKVPKTRVLPALPWRPFAKGPNGRPPDGRQPDGRPPDGRPSEGRPSRIEFVETSSVFVQYAADLEPLEKQVAHLEQEKEASLRDLQIDTDRRLLELERNLAIIGLVTFVALFAGGSLLIWIGLRPLHRLSEAVGSISDRDFTLRFEAKRIPDELKPIVERLTTTLNLLRNAFAREKQAAQDISHELRTPLAALVTTIDVALKKPRRAEEYREMLEECRGSADYMSHLVERLMALARLDAGTDRLRVRPVDLAELGRCCMDLIRPLAAAKGLALRSELDESLVVEGDIDKLREILVNLLHNAVEYNRPDGSIDLAIRSDRAGVVLEVRDTGVGIAPEAMPHLFERFYRADPSRHSDAPHCGLGLAIVKSYVDLMGGTIDVRSNPEGTTFRIQLPLRTRTEAIAEATA